MELCLFAFDCVHGAQSRHDLNKALPPQKASLRPEGKTDSEKNKINTRLRGGPGKGAKV
jgi:hypothetical protein